MVNTKDAVGKEGFFSGAFNETQTHNVKDVSGCIDACSNDPACVQITWAPTHSDKCVMYQSLTPVFKPASDNITGWLKLSGRFITPRKHLLE